jgi:hypothetical protein
VSPFGHLQSKRDFIITHLNAGENKELKEIVKALIVNMKSLEHRLAALEARVAEEKK